MQTSAFPGPTASSQPTRAVAGRADGRQGLLGLEWADEDCSAHLKPRPHYFSNLQDLRNNFRILNKKYII